MNSKFLRSIVQHIQNPPKILDLPLFCDIYSNQKSVNKQFYICRLYSAIARVRIVLKRTAVGDCVSTTRAGVIFRVKWIVFVRRWCYKSGPLNYPRFEQTSAGGFDDLDGLLCVQRRLKFNSGRNETVVFAVVVEPKLLTYSSDIYLPNWCNCSQVVRSVVQENVTL